jgi:hypothetical protein
MYCHAVFRHSKYKIHSSFWQRYRQMIQYLFSQKIILSANGFSGERMPIFGQPKIGLPYSYSVGDDFMSLAIYFRFGFPLDGDSLRRRILYILISTPKKTKPCSLEFIIMFFSHNKSTNSTFKSGFSAKRTGRIIYSAIPNLYLYSCVRVRL